MTSAPVEDPVLAIPPAQERSGLFAMTVVFASFFWLVYWSADRYAGALPFRHRVDFGFEAAIPFWPAAILIYLTITPLLALAPFVFRTRLLVMPLFVTLCAEVAIAGSVFFMFPVELGYPTPFAPGWIAAPFFAAKSINLTYNCVPSLHVAFAVTVAAALTRCGGAAWRRTIWTWCAMIAVSTLVTHQHHVVDVISGGFLGFAAMRWIYPKVRLSARHQGEISSWRAASE
jgi:membrane-associated phospholipid phosphatase